MRRAILYLLPPAAFLIFFGGIAIATLSYFAGKPFRFTDAWISAILSPEDNPRGAGIASASATICGILLLPVAFAFYRILGRGKRKLAAAGALVFALGPVCTIAISCVVRDVNRIHVALAYAAFVSMTAGLLILSALAFRGKARGLLLVLLGGVLAVILYDIIGPDATDKYLFTSTAFQEWALCSIVAVTTNALSIKLARRDTFFANAPDRSPKAIIGT
jgi:hypothetical protein